VSAWSPSKGVTRPIDVPAPHGSKGGNLAFFRLFSNSREGFRLAAQFQGGPTCGSGAEYASTMAASPHDAFLGALARSDRGAWGALYDAHLHEIYAFVSHLMEGDRSSCEDLNQEVWLQAISCIERFDPSKGELRDWLFGIARRRVALHFRRLAGANVSLTGDFADENEPADALLLPAEIMERVERLQLVRAAFTAIPQSHQHVLRAKYIDGRSVQEIATGMKTTAKAVESLLSRARGGLRALLGPYFAPVPQHRGASS
jgi:RNA polymerase sigma-70 factor (ECF subfamily)